MTKPSSVKWYSFDRSELPLALIGQHQECNELRSNNIGSVLTESKILLGYSTEKLKGKIYDPPVIIMVDDNDSSDVFSWLKSFVPESSPLTQYARVITRSDWERSVLNANILSTTHNNRADRWASIIIGEILSQSYSDDLKAIPTVVASACLTNAVARTALLYLSEVSYKTCVQRLESLELDGRFAKKHVKVADMLPIWTLIQTDYQDNLDVIDAVNVILDSAFDYAKYTSPNRYLIKELSITNFPGLYGDSIESRVIDFNKLVKSLDSSNGGSDSIVENVQLAAGAFLVGRGTSHAFLLNKLTGKWPSVFLWFSLIAAYAGHKSWDLNWSRLLKVTERNLRSALDLSDSPACDLCWPEYSWLAKTYSGLDVFIDLPRQASKSLLIEILPGASCQFKFSSGNTIDSLEKDSSKDLLKRELELKIFFDKFIGLATEAQKLMVKSSVNEKVQQDSLFLTEASTNRQNYSQARRVRIKKPRV